MLNVWSEHGIRICCVGFESCVVRVLFFLWVAFRWSTLCRLRRTSTAELTLTYDEALEEGSVPDKGRFEVSLAGGAAQAVSAVAVDGSEVTLILATPALFGQTVTLTYTVPATNPLRDLFGNDAGALTNHPVTNETIVLVVVPVVSVTAVHAKAAPLLADAVFRLTASPAPASDLAVTLSIEQAGAYLASPTQTVTIPAGQTSATRTFPIANDYTLASGGLTATVTGGGRLYVPAPANAATVQVVVVDPLIVAQWAENAYTVAEGKDATAAVTLKTAAGMPKPRAAYAVTVFTTNHTAVAGDDFTAVSGEVTVQPGDWTADGAVFAASVPATVETVDDSLLEGEERFRLQVSAVTGQAPLGLECPAGLRDLGGAGRCATVIAIDETLSVTAVTVTSTPAAGETYLGGRDDRVHGDVHHPGDGDRHADVRVHAGCRDAQGGVCERLGHGRTGVLLHRAGGRESIPTASRGVRTRSSSTAGPCG